MRVARPRRATPGRRRVRQGQRRTWHSLRGLPWLLLVLRGHYAQARTTQQGPPKRALSIREADRKSLALALEERAQLLRARRVAQLAQRLRLDLPDALARHVELLADLFQRVVGVHLDAEAHAQHLGLARRERIEHVLGRFAQARVERRIRGREAGLVLDEVAQVRIVVVADRRLHRDRLF